MLSGYRTTDDPGLSITARRLRADRLNAYPYRHRWSRATEWIAAALGTALIAAAAYVALVMT